MIGAMMYIIVLMFYIKMHQMYFILLKWFEYLFNHLFIILFIYYISSSIILFLTSNSCYYSSNYTFLFILIPQQFISLHFDLKHNFVNTIINVNETDNIVNSVISFI